MGVALIAWGRFFGPNGSRITVPAPSTTPGAPWLLDFLADEVGRLRDVGFSAIQLPPTSKVQGGAGDGCDGYGVFDRRDLGSKSQQGSVPTRYGSVDSLRRFVANAHAAGLDVYLDVVMHQLIGENGGRACSGTSGLMALRMPGVGRCTQVAFAVCRRRTDLRMRCRCQPMISNSAVSWSIRTASRLGIR